MDTNGGAVRKRESKGNAQAVPSGTEISELQFVQKCVSMKKMSEIMKEMALTVLVKPEVTPSSEAAHVALLLASTAWNKSIGVSVNNVLFNSMIQDFENSNPNFWEELISNDNEALINGLIEFKKKHYPDDSRKITVCGMRDQNVRVEWTDAFR